MKRKTVANLAIILPLLAMAGRKRGGRNVVNTRMYDSTGKQYEVEYKILPLHCSPKSGEGPNKLPDGSVKPSNVPCSSYAYGNAVYAKTQGYPEEFQARELSSPAEVAKIRNMVENFDPLRVVAPSLDPTIGPPVTWNGYVIAGNGRTIALARWLQSSMSAESNRKIYRELVHLYFPELLKNLEQREGKYGLEWKCLVRAVDHLTFEEAVQLAGASQASTAGEETPLRKSLSRFRSWGVPDIMEMPPITTPMPLNRDTIRKFIDANSGFWYWTLNNIPDMLRTSVLNQTEANIRLDVARAMMVGLFLPPIIIESGFASETEEQVVMSMLPYVGALHQKVMAGKIYPYYDLLPHWEDARELSAITVGKGYKQSVDWYNARCDKNQVKMFSQIRDPICELNKLGVALAFFIKHASNLANPRSAILRLNDYIEAVAKEDPRQLSFVPKSLSVQGAQDQAYDIFLETVLPKKVTSALGRGVFG